MMEKLWKLAAKVFLRLSNAAVVWLWVMNGLRLAMGLLVLPLILHYLSTEELGMYYVLLSLTALVPLIDFGFSMTIERAVCFAMGGAADIQAQGVVTATGDRSPNWFLLWRLFASTRRLYRYLAAGALILLGVIGTYAVELRVHELASPNQARLAWGITLLAGVFEIYFGWWVIFLRGMNQVLLSARILVLAYSLRLALACTFLLAGLGLLALPIATFLSSLVLRFVARHYCLRLMRDPAPEGAQADWRTLVKKLWPNSWRLGLQICSCYLTSYANTLICLQVFGLAANAKYGLSLQILMVIQGMSAVWTSAKWPIVSQYRTQQDYVAIRKILWPRIWLQSASFVFMSAFAIVVGPVLLTWIGSGKTMLPTFWLTLMALNSFLEMQFILWGTVISTENRLPYLWPALATNILGFCLSVVLIHQPALGLRGLVLGPLIAGVLFNYWYWPLASARNIRTSLFRYMFSIPQNLRTG